MAKNITIQATFADIVSKMKMHLSIIGKRARDINGNLLFSDLVPSSTEEPVFVDLVETACEAIVAELGDICSSYTIESNTSISFALASSRWDTSSMDITNALTEAIHNYLFNYALGQYLAIIRPSTGEKYPPLYGQTYINHCALIIRNIKTMGFIKRPANKPSVSYSSLTSSISK